MKKSVLMRDTLSIEETTIIISLHEAHERYEMISVQLMKIEIVDGSVCYYMLMAHGTRVSRR